MHINIKIYIIQVYSTHTKNNSSRLLFVRHFLYFFFWWFFFFSCWKLVCPKFVTWRWSCVNGVFDGSIRSHMTTVLPGRNRTDRQTERWVEGNREQRLGCCTLYDKTLWNVCSSSRQLRRTLRSIHLFIPSAACHFDDAGRKKKGTFLVLALSCSNTSLVAVLTWTSKELFRQPQRLLQPLLPKTGSNKTRKSSEK